MKPSTDASSVSNQGLLDSLNTLKGGRSAAGTQRRARFALHLIESRAATVARGRHHQLAPLLTEATHRKQTDDFFDAISQDAQDTTSVGIRDLEMSTEAWRPLVPRNPSIRANIVALLAEKHTFAKRNIPGIREAFGMESAEFESAFESITGRAVASAYATHQSPIERIRWTWTATGIRVERLPPFWTAFALTLTETVGAGALALPIAFATIGPLAGVALLLILGLVNLITVACLAEASARNGSIRYGSAFIGRLVEDFLGKPASIAARCAMFALCCFFLVAYYTGFAATLDAMTGVPAPAWVCVITAVGVYLVLRKNLTGTLTSALLIGFINISILIALSVLALSASSTERLLYIEPGLLQLTEIDASHLQLVFGVVLVAYFGHLSVSNCAQSVLRRDPSGHSLKRGTVAAMLTAIAIYCLWSFSIGGAVDADRLAQESGTVLIPLAEAIGPEVFLLGGVFVVLGLGMSSVHFGLGIFNVSREFFETRVQGASADKLLLGMHRGTLVSLLPIALVFLYVQWTFFTQQSSFTTPLKLLGALLTPILAGVFPALLLVSSRRQGLTAAGATVPRPFGSAPALFIIMALSFAGLLAHGLIIWNSAALTVSALTVAAGLLVLVVDTIRRGAFVPSVCLEVRYFQENGDVARVMAAYRGRTVSPALEIRRRDGTTETLAASGLVSRFSEVTDMSLRLPRRIGANVNVFAYSVTADNETSPLDGQITFEPDDLHYETVQLSEVTGTTRTQAPPPHWRARLQLHTAEPTQTAAVRTPSHTQPNLPITDRAIGNNDVDVWLGTDSDRS